MEAVKNMTSLVVRRTAACIASAAALAAVVPATAAAKTDRLTQCAGESIIGRGSTFQNPVQQVWNKGFNINKKGAACSGKQGSKGKPTATYRNTESKDQGSGSCLKAFGAGATKNTEYDYCGTDEAPNPTQKGEIEAQLKGSALGEPEDWLETIPVLQGAVAVIVHLPEGCTATAEPSTGKIQRLVLNKATLEGIYRGTITKWSTVIADQGTGNGSDKLTCTGGAPEEEETIRPVVRLDKSGTTHIFKEFLTQVNTASFEAEAFNEINESPEKEHSKPCPSPKGEEPETWLKVGEGCENQRWPAAANVLRPSSGHTGNPGVIETVNATPSSIGYADLAVAREKKDFSAASAGGGEGKAKFWAEVENVNKKGKKTYSDPASNGDVEAAENSNCKKTAYIDTETGHEFPPESTRDSWSQAKADDEGKTYPICGLTYDLAFKLYDPFFQGAKTEEQGVALATTVENYLSFELSKSAGGKEAQHVDYYPLPSNVLAEAIEGVEEIGYKEST